MKFAFATFAVWRRWSFAQHVTAAIVVVLVAALGAAGAMSNAAVRRSVVSAAEARVTGASAEFAALMLTSLRNQSRQTDSIANDPAVRAVLRRAAGPADRARVAAAAGDLRRRVPAVEAVEIWDSTGARIAVNGRSLRALEPAPYLAAARSGAMLVSPFHRDGDTVRVAVGVAVRDGERAIGYVIQRRRMTATPQGISALSDLMGQSARVLLGSDNGVWTDLAGAVSSPPDGTKLGEALRRYRRQDGVDVLASRSELAGTPWRAHVEFPAAELLGPLASAQRSLLWTGLGVLAIAALVSWTLARRVTEPIRRLEEATATIADGELSLRIRADRDDEVGRLARAFNAMAERLETGRRTLEKRVEDRTRELAASEERFRQSLESLNDGVIAADTSGVITYANSAAARMLGWTQVQMTGLRIEALVPDNYLAAHRAGFGAFDAAASAGAPPRRLTARARRRDGSEFPVEIAVSAAVMNGEARIIASVSDTTDREVAREADIRAAAARESESRLRRLLDSNIIGIIHWEADGGITYANDEYLRIVGYSRDELARGLVRWNVLTLPEYLPRDAKALAELAATGVSAPYEKEYLRKDGTRVSVLVGRTTFDADHTRGIGFVLDLSERRNLEAQLRQTQKMESVGRLAGGVAHDFNNLLTVILAECDAAGQLPVSGNVAEALAAIRAAGERAAQLTRQLLTFSRQQVVTTTVFDLDDAVRGTEQMLRRLIGEEVSLVTRLDGQPKRVSMDRSQFEQVLVNLVVNARDAMSRGGTVTVSTRTVALPPEGGAAPADMIAGRCVVLTVSDTGDGIAAEFRERVFEPFFTTKDPGRGTGLGLATCYGIARDAGGQLRIGETGPGGSTFELWLPATEHSPSVPTPIPTARAASPGARTIVLVEDDVAVRRVTARILERAGYRVFAVGGAKEALEVLTAEPDVDLLLTDVVMPAMDGPALAAAARAFRPTLKLLFMSGYTEDRRLRTHSEWADFRLLPKPFTAESLTSAVADVLATAATRD